MTNRNIEIKKATIADIPLINELAHIVFPATYKEILSEEQLVFMMDMMYSADSILEQMNKGHVYFLIMENNEYMGYVSIEHQDEDLFHLQKIYVLPHAQGTGLGRLLFNKAIEYIKSIHPGPCTMELNVNRHNKALGFYTHLGMKMVRQGDFPIGNGFYMNDYIMSMDI